MFDPVAAGTYRIEMQIRMYCQGIAGSSQSNMTGAYCYGNLNAVEFRL
jgi:hypothetical protein